MIPDCIAALLALQIEIPKVKDERLFAVPNGFLEYLGRLPRRCQRCEPAANKGFDAPVVGDRSDDARDGLLFNPYLDMEGLRPPKVLSVGGDRIFQGLSRVVESRAAVIPAGRIYKAAERDETLLAPLGKVTSQRVKSGFRLRNHASRREPIA